MKSITFLELISFLFFLIIAGCSSQHLVTSIEDLNTAKKMEGTFGYQCRSASVPGLLTYRPGEIYCDRLYRTPSTSIGISSDPNHSYIVAATLEYGGNFNDLLKIRDKIQIVKQKAVNVVVDKMYLNSLQYLNYQVLSDPNSKKRVNEPNQKDISEAYDKYITSRNNFNTDCNSLYTDIKKRNIFIYRWTASSTVKSDNRFGDILVAFFSSREQYSGFAIVGGVRVSTLYLGHDIIDKWPLQSWISRSPGDIFKVTTFLMEGRHILYVSDYESETDLKARIEATYSQLKKPFKTIKDLDKIELDVVLSKLSNLSNCGVLTKAKYSKHRVSWDDIGCRECKPPVDPNGWQPFYAVQTQLDDLTALSLDISARESKRNVFEDIALVFNKFFGMGIKENMRGKTKN